MRVFVEGQRRRGGGSLFPRRWRWCCTRAVVSSYVAVLVGEGLWGSVALYDSYSHEIGTLQERPGFEHSQYTAHYNLLHILGK
jgi:hypothetical protein